MECNKDEALRAKDLAEQKMLKNDFEGARKIALKAKNLYPELDNISQLISVCEVHCSALNKINNTEKDLYGILKVEKLADETTIRKQYRKLALALHPDKNKFPGAESAFKLIGEANMILSDKGKRSVYDIKCREPVRVTKIHNRPTSQQSSYSGQPKFNSVPNSQFNGVNHHRPYSASNFSNLSFWTYCPFCNIKYEYLREHLNRHLRCQHCSKLFIAHDIGAQGARAGPGFVPESATQGPKRAQPSFTQQKEGVKQEKVKVKVNTPKETHVPSSTGLKFAQSAKPEGVKKPMETETVKESNKKRGRKVEVEEVSEISSDSEDGFLADDNDTNNNNSNRRSSRKKQKVSYREDDNELSPLKRQKNVKKSSNNVEDVRKEANGSIPNGKVHEEEASKSVSDVSGSDSDSEPDPELVDCPEPEFSNFDKHKEDHCFAADQIWACYDSVDGMPRFYAQIKKVFPSEFKVRITWLESEPENDSEVKWVEEELPVACGKFVHGESEIKRDRLMFSHQIAYRKGVTKSLYLIYPQKGEIWALFKNWDIRWSSDPKNHKKNKFDIVQILSVDDKVISVMFLLKVKGFVSLFQTTNYTEKIPFSDVFRCSHNIPFVTLNGSERAGVPSGCFELDPAAFPVDLEEYHYSMNLTPKIVNLEKVNKEKVKATPKKQANDNVEKVNVAKVDVGKVNEEKVKATPKKQVNGAIENDILNVRRSPRGLKGAVDQTPSKSQDRLKELTKSPKLSSPPSASKKSDKVIHDFNSEKATWKFKVGQIWAFWETNNGIHQQRYAKIRQIESKPLGLQISLLRLCNLLSDYTNHHSACGLFKVAPGRSKPFLPDSFSHMVTAQESGKNVISIYPMEKQIWALYNESSKECEIVEVLETDASSIKVMSLTRVPGYKAVYKASRIQRSTARIVVIPKIEVMNRFSHQIPALLFTEEKDGSLKGCWELDPAALAGLPLVGSSQG